MVRHLAFVILLAAALPARGQIYECVDQSGNKRFTNIAAEAKGCRPLNVAISAPAAPMQPAAAPVKSQSKTPPVATPASFPRVERGLQQQRDNDRRRILEQELGQEEKLLADARRELATQDSSRIAQHARESDRVDPLQKKIRLHEDNVASLRREISKIR